MRNNDRNQLFGNTLDEMELDLKKLVYWVSCISYYIYCTVSQLKTRPLFFKINRDLALLLYEYFFSNASMVAAWI